MKKHLWALILAAIPLAAEIVTITPIYYPIAPVGGTGAYNVQSAALATIGEKVALLFQAPKSGTISKIRFRSSTVTTAATIDVRLETIGTDGRPSGTLWGTDTNVTQSVSASNTDYYVTLTAGAAVTQADALALVFAAPGSGNCSLNIAGLGDFHPRPSGFPTVLRYTSSAWTAPGTIAGTSVVAFEYSDGSYAFVPGVMPINSFSSQSSWNSGTNPNHRGLRFSFPVKVRVKGAFVQAGTAAAGTGFTLKLISGGSSLLTSVVHDGDRSGYNQSEPLELLFPTSVTLEANTYYRLVVLPSETTPNVLLEDTGVAAVAVMAAMPGGADFHWTQGNNPSVEGDWTQTTTKYPIMGLLIDGIDIPTGGGAVAAMPTVISH